jgi:hypothetical protein
MSGFCGFCNPLMCEWSEVSWVPKSSVGVQILFQILWFVDVQIS